MSYSNIHFVSFVAALPEALVLYIQMSLCDGRELCRIWKDWDYWLWLYA